MSNKVISSVVHGLALVAGLSSLLSVALTQPPFSLPPIVAGGFALGATVCTYVCNSLPAINAATPDGTKSTQPPVG